MLKLYRSFTYLINSIAIIYIVAEFIDGFSTFLVEDYLILILILTVLFTSFSLCIVSKHFSDNKRGKVILPAEIKSMMQEGDINKGIVWANFTLGFLISSMIIIYSFQESINDIISDTSRFISILLIIIYGLVQMHFSILINKIKK